jgi:hypothetical protein
MILFYFTYVLAILLGIFCPDYTVLDGSGTTEPIPMITFVMLYLIGGGFWWLRYYRDHPVIGPIYNVVKLFFIVLFATLMYGFVKEKVKDEFKEWTGKK